MFTCERQFVNFLNLADFSALTTALGNATFQAGDIIKYRFTTRWYATVNTGGATITLATA